MSGRKVHFSPFTGLLAGMAACGRDLDRPTSYAGTAGTAEPDKVTCARCRASLAMRRARAEARDREREAAR